MPSAELIALTGFATAVLAMLLVTQTRERVAWPGWLVPLAVALPLATSAGMAIDREGLSGFWSLVTGSAWGLHLWLDRLMLMAAAFFLLQNRARNAGMKSEVWVLAIIVTGGVGLLLMLACTVYLERQQAREAV